MQSRQGATTVEPARKKNKKIGGRSRKGGVKRRRGWRRVDGK